MMDIKKSSYNVEAETLSAGEYPTSLDGLLPAIYGYGGGVGQVSSGGTVEQQSQSLEYLNSTINHNTLHRHTLSTRTIAHYCRLEQIGEGTYGQVYRAKCLTSTLAHPAGGEIMVALKKIKLHHPGYWGMPQTVLREIKILKKLQHKNMVKMYEVVSSKGVEELDWEDEREDERRKREQLSDNNTTPLANSDTTLTPAGSKKIILESGNHSTTILSSSNAKPGSVTAINAAALAKKNKKRGTSDASTMNEMEKLRESYKGNLFLVLEYISHDLTGLLDMAYKFTEIQIKSIYKQLLDVLDFMHTRNYVHRDLKTSNILLTDRYEVKLADFGLARSLDSSFIGRVGNNDVGSNDGDFTNKVITLWYRPPELLLGETKYGTAVDIWSAGCILAEIFTSRPLLTGKTEMDQLKLIFDLIGTPNETSWEGFRDLKFIRTGEVTIDKQRQPKLREKYSNKIQPATALSLFEKCLELDPKKRVTASRALEHRYFQSEPIAPLDPRELGIINLGGDGGAGCHEFQTKKRRRDAKAVAKLAEEESKSRGERLEKQKEAFDRAYRDHLTKQNSDSVTLNPSKQRKTRSRLSMMLAASARGVLIANARRQCTTSSRRCLSSLAHSLSFDSGDFNCRRTLVPRIKPVISQSSIRWFSPTAIASADLPYHIVVGMPALSPTMEQGIISKWNVKEGDSFAAGDSLAVIETDKASMDFEAQDDGVVAKILVSEGGDATNCGSPIMVTVEDTGDVGAFANFSAGASPPAAPSPKRDVATPAPAAAIPKPAVDLPYHIVVGMPALSPTMEQGTISKWNVKEGDSFAAGDSLAVIETDKASMDFEAQDDGVVAKLLVKEGTSDVKVGTEIMVTVEDTADVGAFASFVAGASAAPASSSAAASTPPPVAAPSPKRDVATPAPASAIPPPTAVTLAAPTAAPTAPVLAAPSDAILLGGTEWGLLAAVKSPLAKMMANKQKEYIAKYGSSGHIPVV